MHDILYAYAFKKIQINKVISNFSCQINVVR